MPRKRMIDPEFWSDEEIGQWSDRAKLFYIALWNFSDDEGRLKAHPDLLKAQIFPYTPKVDIAKLKTEVSAKVQWYETDGFQYGFVRNFLKHQSLDRPKASKLPPPPPIDDSSTTNRRTVDQKRKEENRKEENRKDAPTLQDFIESLKTNPVYKHIDIERELGKMDAWLLAHPGRLKTKRFIVNWLNKIDVGIPVNAEKVDKWNKL